MRIYPNFRTAISAVRQDLKEFSYEVHPERWQSTDVSSKPEALMREVLGVSFQAQISTGENLELLARDIEPNLPWADDHFLERVCGEPLNPGVQWRNWPWSNSADKFRTTNEGFSHTYMERYWPTFKQHCEPLMGIRYRYGDLNDVVNHLQAQPLTRQAYLPVWFPEDTGVVHGERVPCTLGYHFIQRHGFLHCTYYIRSCDFYRHFRDDLYLSVRLQLWILEQLRGKAPENWMKVSPGFFTFHCVSMHCFVNDWRKI